MYQHRLSHIEWLGRMKIVGNVSSQRQLHRRRLQDLGNDLMSIGTLFRK